MLLKVLTMVMEMALAHGGGTAPAPAAAAIAQLSMQTLRRALAMATIVALGLLLFFSGLLVVLADLILSSREAGGISLSSVAVVGLVLMIASIFSFLFAFRHSVWSPGFVEPVMVAPSASTAGPRAPSPLNDAIAALVLDFVTERRKARQSDASADAESTSSSKF